jgi:hypothetical protein
MLLSMSCGFAPHYHGARHHKSRQYCCRAVILAVNITADTVARGQYILTDLIILAATIGGRIGSLLTDTGNL